MSLIRGSKTSHFIRERANRKIQLLKFIEKDSGIDETKLKGVFSLACGLSFKKIEQYLEELEAAGLIELSMGNVFYIAPKENET